MRSSDGLPRTTPLFRAGAVLPALLLVGALSACRPPADDGAGGAGSAGADGATVRVEIAGEPALGEVPVAVYVLDGADGVSGAEVEITGDMTHAGMAPVVRTAVEVEPGLYRADDFEFTMAGDWIVSADVTLPDGRDLLGEARATVPSGAPTAAD